jgi:hypothetical protein
MSFSAFPASSQEQHPNRAGAMGVELDATGGVGAIGALIPLGWNAIGADVKPQQRPMYV